MTTKLLSVLLALAILGSGLAAGASDGIGIGNQTTTETDSRVVFGDADLTTERGGTVSIPVELTGTDTASLKIGTEDAVNYALDVTVEDGNGDGQVVVVFDTDAAGEPNATKVTTEASEDAATVNDETADFEGEPPYPALAPGAYPVELYDDEDRFVAESRLRIEEASTTEGPMTETTVDETTDIATTMDETTDIATTEEDTTDIATETSDDTESSVPGFGPTVALVALAGAAMLVARR
ncbi:DUF7827 domain-containing protein [Halorussus amylolyticus]|uniref:DUF7827 domain-containing protein n=1 Tax=Halorussus amylolyticus TaxID=1126242 RepID=UPI00104F730A|nr:PGF-CTERM sorting domain-containing protein [Halorussus amylolyticus]